MLKDVCIVAAAIVTDRRIVSVDQRARKLYARYADQLKKVRGTMWVRPQDGDDRVIRWIRAGAPEQNWCNLGSC